MIHSSIFTYLLIKSLATFDTSNQKRLFSGSPAINKLSYFKRSSPGGTRWTARTANSWIWRAFTKLVFRMT